MKKRNSLSASRAHDYVDTLFKNKKKVSNLRQTGDFLPLMSGHIYYKNLNENNEEICSAEDYSNDGKFIITIKTEGTKKEYAVKNGEDKVRLDEGQMDLLLEFYREMKYISGMETPPLERSPRVYFDASPRDKRHISPRIPVLHVDDYPKFENPTTPRNSINPERCN